MPGRFFAIDPAVRFPVMFPDCVFLVRLSLRPSVYPCVLVPVYLCARPRILPSLFRLILALILVPLRPCPPFISAIRPSLRARNPSGYFSRKMLRCASSGLRRSSSRNRQQQHERCDEQVLVLLVELFETHHRQLGLFHFVDALYDLVEADRLLGRTHVGAARDPGHLGEHLLVELRDDRPSRP